MHENGRLYFEGNAGENAPANTKNAPAAIKTGVPAAAGLPGPQERKHSLGRWTLGRIAPFGRCLISCIYCANALSETDVPAQGGSKGRSPPGNHVPDAERNTGYISNISQLSDSVNHNASPNDMGRNKEKTMEQEPIQPALSPLVTLGLKFHRLKRTRKIQSIMLSLTKTPYITPVNDLPQGSSKIASVSDDTDVPARSGSTGRSPPANTSQTPRITLAVISLYHSLWALSIKSRKKPAQQPVPGRCAYAYRLPGWRGMYVPMGPVFISPWSTASVPRR